MTSERPNGDIIHVNPDPVTFDFHARNVYLTYPRCPWTTGDALDAIVSRLATRWSFACISHELHQDGGDHLHGVICFKV